METKVKTSVVIFILTLRLLNYLTLTINYGSKKSKILISHLNRVSISLSLFIFNHNKQTITHIVVRGKIMVFPNKDMQTTFGLDYL